MLEALRAHHGFLPAFFGGHSLGEYTALVAARVLTIADAVNLVSLRGRLMQEAVPAGAGAMTAIIRADLNVDVLRAIVGPLGVDVANHNALDQAVLSGMKEDVAVAVDAVKRSEQVRARAIPLRVSAPFHSRHMHSVADPLGDALRDVEQMAMSQAVHVVSNTTGSFHSGSRIDLEHQLVLQVMSTVRWVDCMRELLRRECDVFEVGPGKPLRGFFASLGVEIRSITSVASIPGAKA
jgi:[acyl-carrier-protein] S-malonyltransferase/trans-AT polyketide synthase/acyltransferase/oxidoreductase domain-containing protein